MLMVVVSLAEDDDGDGVGDAKIIGIDRTKVFFACSVVVQLMAVSQVSTPFFHRWGWWMFMLYSKGEMCTELHRSVHITSGTPEEGVTDEKHVEYDRKGRVTISWLTVLPRFMASFIVNAICMDLIFLYTPLVLMRAGSAMDFAKDTFAIAFIVTLDDLAEPRQLYITNPAFFRRTTALKWVRCCSPLRWITFCCRYCNPRRLISAYSRRG